MSELWIASHIALWIIVIILAIMMLGLLRQLGLIQLRIGIDPGTLITPEGLERGTQAPDFEAMDVRTSKVVRLSEFRGRRVVLIFLSPTCLACRELMPQLNEMANEEHSRHEMLAVCYASEAACDEFVHIFKVRIPLLADPSNAIGERYDVRYNPFAYLLDTSGTVLIRGIVNSWTHLDALIKEEGTLQTRPWQLAEERTQSVAPRKGKLSEQESKPVSVGERN